MSETSPLATPLYSHGRHVALRLKPGEDAALIDFGDRYLVAKTDPITFATDLIGWYVVHINANDLAVMGATPKWLMVTLLLPEGTTHEATEEIFDQLVESCNSIGITLVGGHTEITYQLPRPIAVGAMIGEVAKDRVVLTSGASPGDSIVLTKGMAIECTSVLARQVPDALREAGVSRQTIERARNLLFSPGISVAQESTIACDTVDVHAMHDPTEGGVATGLLEMAQAAGVGLVVYEEMLRVLPECEEFCRALNLDPFGLIASGALLAAVPPADVTKLLDALAKEGISAHEVGHITEPQEGLKLRTPEGMRDLPRFERDELARIYGE